VGKDTTKTFGGFAAHTSSYGISNLFTLVRDTHKFEAKYMEKLMGGPPSGEGDTDEVYRARSPIYQAEKARGSVLVRFLFP
jgi:dipeptidyl aminopeptidase/acylaminoacyl peptidase